MEYDNMYTFFWIVRKEHDHKSMREHKPLGICITIVSVLKIYFITTIWLFQVKINIANHSNNNKKGIQVIEIHISPQHQNSLKRA